MLGKADTTRMYNELSALKNFNTCPEQEGITRLLFADEEIMARAYVKQQMVKAGLQVTEDTIGNIYGTLVGSQPELAPVWSGSHIDTVRNAGMYDGTVGVIGALEACRMIRESNAPHRRSIVALIFTSEEPTRFGIGCIGSRTMAGHLSLEQTKSLYDDQGISLFQELERLGYTKLDYDAVRKKKGDVFASVELHIEQAAVLERLGCPIGVVEAICAPTYIQVTLEGQQEHAGSTPMNERRDAMAAASEIILKLESLARSHGNNHTVGTIGKFCAYPNSPNVIAGRTEFTIDIRDIDEMVKQDMTQKICAYIDNVAMLRNLRARYTVTTDDLPCASAPPIIAAITESCKKRNIPIHKMISGAYHDSLMIAEFAPVAMIFVPSRGGISHDPAEYTSIEEIAAGTEVLADTLLSLSNMNEMGEAEQ